AGRVRRRPAHVRLGLAGLHAGGQLRPGLRRGAGADGRPEPHRAGCDLLRYRPAYLCTHRGGKVVLIIDSRRGLVLGEEAGMADVVRAALVQQKWTGDKDSMVKNAVAAVREAAAQGARVTCLQELFYGPYFCQVQEPEWYS